MIIVWALSWWYSSGWFQCMQKQGERLAASYDYFSIDMLLRTLFAPYKQISASRIRGPIALQLRAFVDRTFSRVIGAIIRTMLIIIGVLWIGVQAVFGGVYIAVWSIVPFLPLVGFVLMLSGWVPQWR